MARRAIRDTFGIRTQPTVGDPIETRHQVFAGQLVPPDLDVPSKDTEQVGGEQEGPRSKVAREAMENAAEFEQGGDPGKGTTAVGLGSKADDKKADEDRPAAKSGSTSRKS